MRKNTSNKKGQEEMVGFLLVVVMVMVIGLVLIFFLRPKEVEERDFQLENLLYAVLKTSAEEKTISERIEECENDVGCEELKGFLGEITERAFLRAGFIVGENILGYEVNISEGMEYYKSSGNLTGRSRGAATIVRNSLVKIKFYY